jgi:hypothetical protein
MRTTLIGLALAVTLLCAACGSSSPSSAPPTTTPVTTTPRTPVVRPTQTVFVVRHGTLEADRVPARAVGTPTPEALTTAVLVRGKVTVAGGVATVTNPHPLTGEQIAALVYTLTQLPTIKSVSVLGHPNLTRADEVAYAPEILIESPANGQAMTTRTFHVRGTASVFEGTVVIELTDGLTAPVRHTVTATAGAPDRGTFDQVVTVSSQTRHVTIDAYSPSAENGTPQHEVRTQVAVIAP